MNNIPHTGSLTPDSSTGSVSVSRASSVSSSIAPGAKSAQSGSLSLPMSSSPSRSTPSQSNTVPPVVSPKPPETPATMSAPPPSSTKSPIKGVTTLPTPPVPQPPNTTANHPTNTKTFSTSHSRPPTASRTPSSLSSTQPVTDFTPPKTSTKTSVEAVTPTTTRTRTITDHPVSTLASPVAVSVVNADNGRVSLTTPAVVTVLSTSTGPNGEFVTFTHVVANPTGFSTEDQVSSTGLLGNHGAAAGVFVVVGVVACAIGCCLLFVLSRRRRQSRRKRWLAGIQQRMPSNPFEDPIDPPQMRSISNNRQDVNWDGSAPFAFGDEAGRISLHSSSSHPNDATPLVGTGSGMSPKRVPVPSTDNFLDKTYQNHALGFGVGYGHAFADDRRDRASIAQSSPSIYPASLPPSADEDTTDATQSPTFENTSDSSPRNVVVGAPPRPPRSHLRRSVIKPFEVYPVTPPTSVSSHATSKPPSPVLGQAKVVGRRTLLDVRPRSGQDSGVQELLG